jgi:hypothetical protein
MKTLRLLSGMVALALLAACATPASTPAPAATGSNAAASAPAKAPATGPIAVVNDGFESLVPGRRGDPEGWFTYQHAGDKSYEFTLDTVEPHGGARSLRIHNIGPEPYGAVAQTFEVAPYQGKVARYSAWLRTRDVTDGGAGLTLIALKGSAIMNQNFMTGSAVKGTTGWTRFTITLPIPSGAERLEIGAMQQGKGTLWLDDAVLEFVQP